MKNLPSEVTESTLDIFVLSVSETVIPLLLSTWRENGYRVTLFADTTSLLATLRTGKPNLLICDSHDVKQGGI